jgi:acyl dehydratase
VTVEVGAELPALVVPITTTLIVAGAMASRDFQDVHHDADVAKASGAKDIFMNILTTGGLVGRFITDWTGPGAVIKKMSIRLGAPNYPHDTMTLTGSVSSVDGNAVTVTIRGANSLGDHVTGTVEVVLG